LKNRGIGKGKKEETIEASFHGTKDRTAPNRRENLSQKKEKEKGKGDSRWKGGTAVFVLPIKP